VDVQVTLDGAPAADVLVLQAGRPEAAVRADGDGYVSIELDLSILGDLVVVASHPDARLATVSVYPDFLQPSYLVELLRFDTADNPDYLYEPAGTPENSPNTEYCGHCHFTMVDQWYDSAHRNSASNPTVRDLFAGAAAAYADEASCLSAGGTWLLGQTPGTTEPGWRCYIGEGVLPTLNPGCGDEETPCDGKGEVFGGCADCHAPSINGVIGGRSLQEATGWAHEWGVQCESCHRVESVDETSMEPGVAGRLRILRPTEAPISPTLGEWAPLIFGPGHDTISVRMGSVQRDHFHQAILCSGCHEQHQPVLVPDATIDSERWPSGRLPIHTTFSEWKDGPMNPAAPCQSCHMPPDPLVSNAADQQVSEAEIGYVSGYLRKPGEVNKHTWDGPRATDSGMLQLAAVVFVQKEVTEGVLTATVTTRNSGPGHAIPTGEPMRALLLEVEARCGEAPLVPVGGDVIPSFGGHLDRQEALSPEDSSNDWALWPGADVGDIIRVIQKTGAWLDYQGTGPFGDGTFTAEEKGMAVEVYVGESTVIAVEADGSVTLDNPLPTGDVAYRVRGQALAGAPGFGFARVLTGKDGTEMVPHFLAVDVRSDNRLRPQQSMTTTHRFETSCPDPTVDARLLHRAYPYRLAKERNWPLEDTLMTRVQR
jgi:hypothetical protein